MLPSPFYINAQYIKDLSFENPDSISKIFLKDQSPNISIGIDIKAQRIEKNKYEVILIINGNVTKEKNRLFLIELSYAGIFSFENKQIQNEEYLSFFLLTTCPEFLFPFARAIIANITREAGFPSLTLSPIDFKLLYKKNITTNFPK